MRDAYEYGVLATLGACGIGPGDSRSPEIYGQVGSPDLTGNGAVDAGDLDAFATYLGRPITVQRGWQADFNDSGGTVDAGDLAWLSGRLGQDCFSQKAGDDVYDMRVENLDLEPVQELMASQNLTKSDIIRLWDEMGLTYDRDAAADIASEQPQLVTSWGHVKSLYKN